MQIWLAFAVARGAASWRVFWVGLTCWVGLGLSIAFGGVNPRSFRNTDVFGGADG